MQIYQGYYQPKESRFDNIMECFNEIIIMLATYHLMTFTDWILDFDVQYQMGWSFIIIVSLNVLVNMFFILKAALHDMKMLIIKYWRKFKLWWNHYFSDPNKKPPPEPVKVFEEPKKVEENMIDLSKLPEWPKEAPSMVEYQNNVKVVNGQWKKINDKLVDKLKKLGKDEEHLDSIPEEDSSELSEKAPERYQPSMNLVHGKWVKIGRMGDDLENKLASQLPQNTDDVEDTKKKSNGSAGDDDDDSSYTDSSGDQSKNKSHVFRTPTPEYRPQPQ